jgi:hypothetical protein
MNDKEIWSGPALANPRNRVIDSRSARLEDQEETVQRPLLALSIRDLPQRIRLVTPVGPIEGRCDTDELSVVDRIRVRFFIWEDPPGDSTVTRFAWKVEVDVVAGEIKLSLIAVMPDRLSA